MPSFDEAMEATKDRAIPLSKLIAAEKTGIAPTRANAEKMMVELLRTDPELVMEQAKLILASHRRENPPKVWIERQALGEYALFYPDIGVLGEPRPLLDAWRAARAVDLDADVRDSERVRIGPCPGARLP